MSGLGEKKLEIDLTKMLDKTIIAILGDNGKGKSALAGMIPPTHVPLSHNKKYVLKGREGLLIKRYYAPDGSYIETKTVSVPKNSHDKDKWSHSNKVFFMLVRDGEETELNPSGNVDSYYELVYQYFGVTKSTLSTTIYNKKVEGLVSLSSSDRIKQITSFIPNSDELMRRYKIGNELYRRVKNEMKNISQKLGKLKDSAVLKKELSNIEESINTFVSGREKIISELAICKNDRDRLENSEGKSIKKSYNTIYDEFSDNTDIIHYTKKLLDRYDSITETPNELLLKKEKISSDLALASQVFLSTEEKITEIEKDIEDLESEIISTETEDIEDLKNELVLLQEQRSGLQYSNYVGTFDSMNYDSAEMLHDSLEMIKNQFDILIDNYGEIVSHYYSDSGPFCTTNKQSYFEEHYHKLRDKSESLSRDISSVGREIMKIDAKSYLKSVLDKRPTECSIDSCGFIEEALIWPKLENQLLSLKDTEMKLSKEYTSVVKEMEEYEEIIKFLKDHKTFKFLLESNKNSISLYLKISLKEIYKSFKSGITHKIFNLNEISDIMSILSEKRFYEELTTKITTLSHEIDKLDVNSGAMKLITKRLKDNTERVTELYKDKARSNNRKIFLTKEFDAIEYNISSALEKEKLIEKNKELIIKNEDIEKRLKDIKDKLSVLEDIEDIIKGFKNKLNEYDAKIQPLISQRDIIKFELNQRNSLELERDELEHSLVVQEIISDMTKPGKGMWKVLFNIYMDGVRNVANMLLSQTFDKDLELEKFDIETDKFQIPYTYQGVLGEDASEASGAQRAAISICIALGMMEDIMDKYGIAVFDEADKDMSPKRRLEFVNIILDQAGYIGLSQIFAITHSPDAYEREGIGYILFPGHTLDTDQYKKREYIKVA